MSLEEFLQAKLESYRKELVQRQQQLAQIQARIYHLQGAIDVCQDILAFIAKGENAEGPLNQES